MGEKILELRVTSHDLKRRISFLLNTWPSLGLHWNMYSHLIAVLLLNKIRHPRDVYLQDNFQFASSKPQHKVQQRLNSNNFTIL